MFLRINLLDFLQSGVKNKKRGKLPLLKQPAMTTNGKAQVKLHAFLTSSMDGRQRLASRSGRFTPSERALPQLCPLNWRLGRPHSSSGRDGEDKNNP